MNHLLHELQALIGREAVVDGARCQVIEILEHGPCVVVCEIAGYQIQPNQFGDPQRRVPRTHTLPLRSQIENDIHPVVRLFAGEALTDRLRAFL